MKSVRHGAARRQRLLAALALFAAVSGSLGTLFHQASTAHGRCPEHGELIHGAAESAEPLGASLPAADDAARMRALPRATGDNHDHCTVFCSLRDRMADLAAMAPVEPAAPGPAGLDSLPADRALATRPLYRIAPKNSPPA